MKILLVVITAVLLSGCSAMNEAQANWEATHSYGGNQAMGNYLMATGLQMMNPPRPTTTTTNCVDMGVAGIQCRSTQY